ncbi:thiol reductant ABC exporter subunit CydC [Georgenia sp. EYE_87]|uniref:thiol reductant ABC exporter subunit CydC n=1 Tax=Georgenia sp. EYE_87 TaxID=2853448 RepID=UPI0020036075|nr:thiol reductant ABC exporter subunit CydC [Georgenia sp. EYE_87]MCK6211973.1 thiol reductant ABC exporter subunit CydC [Georgenia sp. EYE_87]
MTAVDTSADAPASTTARGRTVLPAAERRALRRAVGLLDLDRVRLLWAVLAGSASLASGIALTATAAWLIARASQMPPVLELSVAAVAVRTFGISRALLRYLERLASHLVALRGMATLRERVYTTLASGRADAVAGLRRGDLLARTGTDVDAVGDVVVRALLPSVVAAVVGAGSVVLVAWLHLGAGLVLAVCLLMAGLAGPWLTMRAARLAEGAATDARAEISATAMTMVDGAAELTVSGRLRDVVASLRGTERDLARAKDAAARPAALAAGVDTLAMGAAVLGSLVLGIPATVAGSMEAVELAVIVLTPLAAFEGTAMLGPAAVQLVRSGGSAVRIIELLDRAGPATAAAPRHAPAAAAATSRPRVGAAGTAPVEGAARTAASPVQCAAREAASPVQGAAPPSGPRVTARGLAVGWPGGPVVAEGIDLDLAPGRAVAVVGPSGVGKTTLLLTLAGLLPPRAGTVELNGVPVWEADRHRVSADLVLTAEDAHVFGTSVLENLRVARGDVTEREATGLLERAGLGDWLAGLPDGLGTMLGPDAATVSGGERRRLLLARALASPARLLLLDEPGEHLDPATADRLLTDLLRTGVDDGAPPRGVVLVTHRLSPLGAAEEVIVLGARNDGPATVLARGTHERLRADVPAYRWALEQEEHRR